MRHEQPVWQDGLQLDDAQEATHQQHGIDADMTHPPRKGGGRKRGIVQQGVLAPGQLLKVLRGQ